MLMPTYDELFALKKIRDIIFRGKCNSNLWKIKHWERNWIKQIKTSTVIREPIDVDDILRKTPELCMPSEDSLEQMKKTMVTFAIKNTFLELGLEEFDKIVLML